MALTQICNSATLIVENNGALKRHLAIPRAPDGFQSEHARNQLHVTHTPAIIFHRGGNRARSGKARMSV